MTRRHSRRGGPTIGTAFDPRANSLNALRLLLALLVLVAHSGELGGYGRELQPLGAWAVAGFFGISGYLITGSREHSASLADYLWRRLLRIYPAFVVVLVVVAFVIAPASGVLFGTGPWVPGDALAYVLQNAGLWMARLGIGDTLATAPFPGVWNGSLWTLAYEFACYLVIGCLFLAPRAWVRPAVAALFVGSTLVTLGATVGLLPVPHTVSTFSTLLGFFSAGAVVYLWRDRIPLRASLVLTAAVMTVALAAWDAFPGLAGLPLAYLLIALGIRLPLRRIGARTDISYGVYIYAFPLQQVIASATASMQPPLWCFIALSVAGTLPFAWASALLIEQPALRAKGLFSRRRRKTSGQGGGGAGLP